jgi:hypothetical protein
MSAPSIGALPPTTSSLSVSISPDIVASFKAMKQRRTAAWIMYEIDSSSFSLRETARGAPSANAVKDLVRALPPADGRFFVFDLPIKNSYGGTGSRLMFVTWAPSAAGRANVVYAAQRRSLDAVFTGCIDAHAATRDDVEGILTPAGGKDTSDEAWDPDS